MSRARPWVLDATLYGLPALFAAVAAVAADIPLQRSWGRGAVWSYGLAAVLAVGATRLQADERRERRRRAPATSCIRRT